MQQSSGPAPVPVQKPGMLAVIKNTAKEVFGQVLTLKFWLDLTKRVAKVVVDAAYEAAFTAAGDTLILVAQKLKKSPETVEQKEARAAQKPTVAASVFSSGQPSSSGGYSSQRFSDSSLRPMSYPPTPGGFPGLG